MLGSVDDLWILRNSQERKNCVEGTNLFGKSECGRLKTVYWKERGSGNDGTSMDNPNQFPPSYWNTNLYDRRVHLLHVCVRGEKECDVHSVITLESRRDH